MAKLSLQNFGGLVQSMAAAAQGACASLLDFTVGSIMRAVTEAAASMGLWLQWLIILVMQHTRLATSFGAYADSYVNDLFMTRLPAVAASGSVTLSRFYATSPATVLVGSNVKTGDGSKTFTIIADATNTLYNAAIADPGGNVVGGFVIPAATASATFKAVAQVAGVSGNVSANTITLLATAISGIDTVNNASGFVNGMDAESDVALKARFQLYISGLSKATQDAIGSAIVGVQQGLTYNIAINVDNVGNPKPGNFVVTIDDGSGAPPGALQTLVYASVDKARAITETFSVQGPTDVDVTINLTITVAAGIVKADVEGIVAQAITAYVNTLGVGATLPYSMIGKLAYDSLPAGTLTNVTAITINGGSADIVPTASQVVKATVVTVS